MHKGKGSALLPWPQRLNAPPPRLEEIGINAEEFQSDTVRAYHDGQGILPASAILCNVCFQGH